MITTTGVRIPSRIFVLSNFSFWLLLSVGIAERTLLLAEENRFSVQTPARDLADIHVDLRSLERETARATSDKARAKNIVRLCGLFVEIGQHPKISRSPTLQSLSVRLRTRLRGIERRTIKELKRRGIGEPSTVAGVDSRTESSSAVAGYSSTTSTEWNSSSNSPEFEPGHAAPMPDYGWDLVNLIRHTIRPDYWAVAGGPGKALYFGQSRALVIHGSWRVQEDVADLLTALRGY